MSGNSAESDQALSDEIKKIFDLEIDHVSYDGYKGLDSDKESTAIPPIYQKISEMVKTQPQDRSYAEIFALIQKEYESRKKQLQEPQYTNIDEWYRQAQNLSTIKQRLEFFVWNSNSTPEPNLKTVDDFAKADETFKDRTKAYIKAFNSSEIELSVLSRVRANRLLGKEVYSEADSRREKLNSIIGKTQQIWDSICKQISSLFKKTELTPMSTTLTKPNVNSNVIPPIKNDDEQPLGPRP